MEEENLDLDALAALLDEDDDDLLAMVNGETEAVASDCSISAIGDTYSAVDNNRNEVALTEPSVVGTENSSCVTVSDATLKRVESDLTLSDDELNIDEDKNGAPPADEDEAEILALEAKLSALRQKKKSKTSPKSLNDVVSKIKKPPTPNKSRFLDVTGIVPAASRPVPASEIPATSVCREDRIRAMLRKKETSAIHSGDTDSSDDEENRQPFEKRYNEFGRTVRRLAHGSTSREELQQKAERVNRAAVRELKPRTRAKPAEGGRPAMPEQHYQQIMLDSYAQMSVVNARLTPSELSDCMREKRLIRVSQLESHIRGESIPGEWATVGCIARKSEPRTSQKGSSYSSWTLTDLVDCQKSLKVMLFDDAHAGLWKTSVGTVVALANCKLMKEREMQGTGVSVALNSKQHCIILGTSPDLDFCKAKCKNGRICLSFINKRHCPVCVYHMNAEYKKTGAKRGELQSQSSVTPKQPMRSQLASSGGVIHEGQVTGANLAKHSGSAAQRLADKERLKGLQLQKQMAESFHAKKKLSTEGMRHITDMEAKAIRNVAEDSLELGEMLLKPCAGSRNLLKHLTQDSSTPASTDRAAAAPPSRAARQRGNPAALLRAEEVARKRPVPTLARDIAPGDTVDLDVAPRLGRNELAAKARAIALVRKGGGIKKADPNAVRSQASQETRQKVLKRLPDSAGREDAAPSDAAPSSKRSRLADDPRFKAILEARSSHASALEAELSEGQEHYFTALEKKEMIENKMLNTWEMKTKAVYCKKCKYRALSASELCKAEGHTTVLMDAVKRFFACKECKNRTFSLERLPSHPCKNCGSEKWQKAPMGKERKGPKLESEILSIRGNEATHLTGFVKDHNINLEF